MSGWGTRGIRAALVAAAWLWTLPAQAQGVPPAPAKKDQPKRFELAFGMSWAGGRSLGSSNVVETAPDGTAFTLYSTSTSVRPAFGALVSLSRRIGTRLAIEGEGIWSFPVYESRLSGDVEGAADVTASQRAWEFSATGAALVTLGRRPHADIFLRLGGGWLRQISEDRTSYQDGWIGSVGGGVKYWWKDRPRARPVGLRIDARVEARSGGFQPTTRTVRIQPAIGAMLLLKF